MSLSMALVERGLVPDPVLRMAIRRRCARKLREEREAGRSLEVFVEELKASPVAVHTDAANEQHYELPPEFFTRVLGQNLKYSGALFEPGVEDLDEAERAMLDLYVDRARLDDGQSILELGCGWGSLTLHMARRLPNARIVAVSNSRPQREFILGRVEREGIDNVEILTADMNEFTIEDRFDRAVSIEMFEHMKNYEELLGRVAGFLVEDGLLFLHVFAHQRFAYHYVAEGPDDWMARYFFTGGTMPSWDLLPSFDRDFELLDRWQVDGTHYEKTSNAWLENMDGREAEIRPILRQTYGAEEEQRWWVRWRLFFMACAELFGYDHGREWIVAHYLFRKR
jgi:cyclopropane-fatty-acyl-phospholipid synthase